MVDQDPSMHAIHAANRGISRRGLLLTGVAAGLALLDATCGSHTEPEPNPIPDCGEQPVLVDAKTYSSPEGINLLTTIPWDIPGITQKDDSLVVTPINMAVHTKDKDPRGQDIYQPNPAHNTRRQLAVPDKFTLTSRIQNRANGSTTFMIDNQLPLVYDDFVFPRKGVHLTVSDSQLAITQWDGIHQQPQRQIFPLTDLAPTKEITFQRQGDQLTISVSGQTVSTNGANRLFANNRAWLGIAAQDAPATVSHLNIATANQSLEIANMDTLWVAPCIEGFRAVSKYIEVGTAAALTPWLEDARYAALVAGNFSKITPENAMKPQFIQPEEGVFAFAETRQLVDLALRHGIEVHGHALIHSALPQWMRELPTDTPAEKTHVEHVMIDHITGVLQAFTTEEVPNFDVVNEPLDGTNWRRNIFFDAMGEEYIRKAFQAAYKVRPNTTFWLNENSTDKDNPYDETRFQQLLDMAKKIKNDNPNIKIGIGFQGHVYQMPRDTMSPAALARRMQQANDARVLVRVSEMDVTVDSDHGPEAGLAAQRELVTQIATVCIQAQNCTDITFWGVGGPYTSTSTVGRDGRLDTVSNLLWDTGFRQRPAYAALYQALRTTKPTRQT